MASRIVFVVNSGALAGTFANPAAVPPGRLAAFDDNGLPIDVTLGDLNTQKTLLVLGNLELPRLTRVLDPARVASATKRAYLAPVKQVTTVSALAPAGGLPGEAVVKIMDLTLGIEQFPRFNFSVVLVGNETATVVATKLAAAINLNERAKKVVIASVVGDTLVLTARDFATSFVTSLSGPIVNAVRTATAAPSLGSGTAAHIALLEESCGPVMFGEYYVDCGMLGRKEALPTSADPSKTYTVYCIRYENSIHVGLNTSFRYEDIYIAVATTGVVGDLDAFLDPAPSL